MPFIDPSVFKAAAGAKTAAHTTITGHAGGSLHSGGYTGSVHVPVGHHTVVSLGGAGSYYHPPGGSLHSGPPSIGIGITHVFDF
jgi:hypothetical protein